MTTQTCARRVFLTIVIITSWVSAAVLSRVVNNNPLWVPDGKPKLVLGLTLALVVGELYAEGSRVRHSQHTTARHRHCPSV